MGQSYRTMAKALKSDSYKSDFRLLFPKVNVQWLMRHIDVNFKLNFSRMYKSIINRTLQ